jgi:hypothetical protein
MNDKTLVLLEQLAQKLGTTADFLWGILIKQAFLSALTDLIFLIISVLFGLFLYKIHIKFCDSENKWSYYEKEEALAIPMVIAAMLFFVFFLIMLFSCGNIINGLFNPEYWALNKILSSI